MLGFCFFILLTLVLLVINLLVQRSLAKNRRFPDTYAFHESDDFD